MSASLRVHSNESVPNPATATAGLYLAIELGQSTWKLALTTAPSQPPRLKEIPARDTAALQREIAAAKLRFQLPEAAPVCSCYEAGRDGYWLHRWLLAQGVESLIVDSSSIEVNRRARRAKSDSLDAAKLVSMLLRYAGGEKRVWSVIHVPTPAEEDARQTHRELETLKSESTAHINRIKGLLAAVGLSLEVDKTFPKRVAELRQWTGEPLPPALRQRLLREFERLQACNRQIREIDQQRAKQTRQGTTPDSEQVRKLLGLRGIGINSACLFVHEFFSWRKFRNRREVGSLAGLAPTPYTSGNSDREQGISKAGNQRVRWMAVEIAWCWLHHQPLSGLSKWYHARFGQGSSRQRRIGIVALARKLLVALWKYLETGALPEEAEVADWRQKTRAGNSSLEETRLRRVKAALSSG